MELPADLVTDFAVLSRKRRDSVQCLYRSDGHIDLEYQRREKRFPVFATGRCFRDAGNNGNKEFEGEEESRNSRRRVGTEFWREIEHQKLGFLFQKCDSRENFSSNARKTDFQGFVD